MLSYDFLFKFWPIEIFDKETPKWHRRKACRAWNILIGGFSACNFVQELSGCKICFKKFCISDTSKRILFDALILSAGYNNAPFLKFNEFELYWCAVFLTTERRVLVDRFLSLLSFEVFLKYRTWKVSVKVK